MFKTDCQLCGKRVWFSHHSDGFKTCARCREIQKKSGTPMAELVAMNVAGVEAAKARRRSDPIGNVIILAAIAGGCYLFFWRPEWIRTKVQVPVAVQVRESLVGIGNVVQIRNESQRVLKNVGVAVVNEGSNSRRRKVDIGDLAPGETKELGTIDDRWRWTVERGEQITVTAEGFFPIVFTAEQVGVR